MMRVVVIAVGLSSLFGIGCGSSSGAGGAGGGGGTGSSTHSATQSTTGATSGTSMCVMPPDAGNDKGVGHYCTPGGHECMPFPLAALCLADVGQDQWFCTRIGCDATTDCGKDAGCLLDPQGSACVPCKCEPTASGCSTTTSSVSASSASSTTGTSNVSASSTGSGN